MAGAGDAQIERLLVIRLVARGQVAADYERKFMRSQIILKCADVHARCGEGGAFRRLHRLGERRGSRTRDDFHGIEFPQNVCLCDETVRTPVGRAIREAGSKRRAGRVKTICEREKFQPEIVGRVGKCRCAEVGFGQFVAGVCGEEKSVGSHQRIAIESGVVGWDAVRVGGGRARGKRREEIYFHVERVEIRRAGERDDLSAAVRAELRRVNAVKKPRRTRVFAHHEKISDGVCVVIAAEIILVLNVRVVDE